MREALFWPTKVALFYSFPIPQSAIRIQSVFPIPLSLFCFLRGRGRFLALSSVPFLLELPEGLSLLPDGEIRIFGVFLSVGPFNEGDGIPGALHL